jgi:hypothetical protein
MLEPEIGANPIGENDQLVGRIPYRDITIRAAVSGNEVTQLMARHVTTAAIGCCRARDTGTV